MLLQVPPHALSPRPNKASRTSLGANVPILPYGQTAVYCLSQAAGAA